MKAKIVYGAPCSGKTTYVRDNAGDSDFIFDYDRLLFATTNRTMHFAEKHALHWLIMDLRKVFVETAKSADNVECFWLVCTWSTDYIKGLFEGIDTEEIFIEATKKECYDRLDDDESRPDKAEWRLVIDQWFDEHLFQTKGGATAMNIRELLQKRADLHEKAKKFYDERADKNGFMLESDALQLDRMVNELDGMTRAIENFKKLNTLDKELSKPFNTPYFEPFKNSGGGHMKNPARGIHGDDYRKNFLNAIRKNFKDDAATGYLREGALVDGGYLLPTEFHEKLITKLESENVLRQISRVITTASEHRISILTTAPTASWIGEGEEIATSNAQFGQTSLNAYKLAVNLKISNELLQDSYYDLEQFISDEFSKSLGRAEEESFITGAPDVSGNTKQPTGILTVLSQSATGTIQTVGNEISADDILTLIYSLDRAYRKSAVFLASDATIMGLRKLKDSTGNFIWQPSLQEGEPSRIFGTPIFSSNFMPAPASGNIALVFGDFKDYFIIGERGNRTFKPLRELFATSDRTAFLMIERIDCAVADRNAFRGLKIR